MKLLLDACIWRGAKSELELMGHDVCWAGDLGPGISDTDILNLAHQQGRVLITLDKDFGKLSVLHGLPHSGIVRLVDISHSQHALVTDSAVEHHAIALLSGAIMVVKGPKVRMRGPSDPEL